MTYRDPRGVKLHPTTGLPEYPRNPGPTELRLKSAAEDVTAQSNQLRGALDALVDTFADAFDAADRRNATRDRLRGLSDRQRRLP